jgi:hypothetical protein
VTDETRYASRKFLLACTLLLIATWLLMIDAIGSTMWVDMVKWVFGLYCAGNVGASLADILRPGPKS